MRCPSGYLARDGAEMFSCQAGHTVEADLETCCAQDPYNCVRCENGGTCTSTDGSCKCAEVSRNLPARSMLTSAKEIRVGVTACALIAWVSTSVLAMQDTAGKIVISQINVLPGNAMMKLDQVQRKQWNRQWDDRRVLLHMQQWLRGGRLFGTIDMCYGKLGPSRHLLHVPLTTAK